MKHLICVFLYLILLHTTNAQQVYNVSFLHDGKTVYATLTTPAGSGPFPVVIIVPGSGANDRDGTLILTGGNASCLYPALFNDTLRPYKQLAEALTDSGYAVLRYDKLEYTYPGTIGTITFHKLWLPAESAIDYVKTRNDIDTTRIFLIGHSEGSSLIPIIAHSRSDVKALISIAGPRTPLDSLLAYQLIYIAQTCNGDTAMAQLQTDQILGYFDVIRSNTWNSSTPDLFGVPASVWYEYTKATDSVAIYYNLANLPTLFLGMGLDINVPPSELIRFQGEVTVTNDFWSLPGLIHFMTSDTAPDISVQMTDTILYWLRSNNFPTDIVSGVVDDFEFKAYPNPAVEQIHVSVSVNNSEECIFSIYDVYGRFISSLDGIKNHEKICRTIDLKNFSPGIYLLEARVGGSRVMNKIVVN